jgi:alkylation response protein AidB-like acyl-CoA dehydrogenase
MKLWIAAEVNRLTNIRAAESRGLGVPSAAGSIGKLATAELNQEIYDFCMDLLGPASMVYGSYSMDRPPAAASKSIPERFLRSRANSIEGGTSQIMRNILGERVLGLPGESSVEKGVPWIQIPRS